MEMKSLPRYQLKKEPRKLFALRLPISLIERLHDEAYRQESTLTDFVIECIERELERRGKRPKED